MEEDIMTQEKRIAKELLPLAVAAFFVASGCGCSRKATQAPLPLVPIETIAMTKAVHCERIDTVFATIPVQSAERTTREGFSRLETDYAESEARIGPDGTLSHMLRNKRAHMPVHVKTSSDTVYRDSMAEKPVPVEVPVEVERNLTWWQKTRLDTWGWLAVALVLCAGWMFRNPIRLVIRKLQR